MSFLNINFAAFSPFGTGLSEWRGDLNGIGEKVAKWESEASPEENRAEAANCIKIYATSKLKKESLVLKAYNLRNLPDIFDHKCFNILKHLDVSENKLTILPSSIENLSSLEVLILRNNQIMVSPNFSESFKSLEVLDLGNNQLTDLSESIRNLVNLKDLNLVYNKLRTLPDSIGELVSLTRLKVVHNQLNYIPNSIGNLSSLNFLDFGQNELTDLPEDISRCLLLEHLDLRQNKLSRLPEKIVSLTKLSWLYLGSNLITELPINIGNLLNLDSLYLNDNKLTVLPISIKGLFKLKRFEIMKNLLISLPAEIYLLPSICKIYFKEHDFLQQITASIRETISDRNYTGPQFVFSITERVSFNKSIKELLNELFRVVNKNNVSENLFVNIEKTETLRIWLSQLCLMKDFSKSLENKKKIVKKILAILEKANEDKAFYDVFVDVILDGSGTCGDRVALSILYIGINYKLSQFSISKQESLIIKKEKLKDLALFLKGLWGIGLLSFVAGEKIKLMRVEDQIEVHLAYPVMLQKILNLPIDVEDMLFFNISGVLEEDLQNARKFVEFHYASNDLFVEFLINHFKWEEAILNSFLIESQISRACKEEEPDYVGIAEKFKKEMKEKTLEILREISEDVKIKV
jgi:hypothetical protein